MIIACGTLLSNCVDAAQSLREEGLDVGVINARFVKPLDRERITRLARQCRAIVTVEEASLAGGFGAAVLEVLAEEGVSTPTRCLGIPDRLIEHGDPKQIRRAINLDREGITEAVRSLLAVPVSQPAVPVSQSAADGGRTPSSE